MVKIMIVFFLIRIENDVFGLNKIKKEQKNVAMVKIKQFTYTNWLIYIFSSEHKKPHEFIINLI